MVSETIDYVKKIYRDSAIAVYKAKVRSLTAVNKLQPNITGFFCYLLGWISGIIMLMLKRKDTLVRFHAGQSITIFGILTMLIIALNFVKIADGTFYRILVVLYWILVTLTIFLWFFLMFKAYRGQTFRLRMVGNIASKLLPAGDGDVTYCEKDILPGKVEGSTATLGGLLEQETGVVQDFYRLPVTFNETVNSMITLCETRDPYTAAHQNRVAYLSCAIAAEMGLSEGHIEGIRIMALIHDIGKVVLPTEILSKPGMLSDHEIGILRTHPEAAYNILRGVNFPWPVAQAILQHHERLDGSGYPSGLSGENIIFEARILAVSDVIEAMSSHRPYRPALGIDKALDEISRSRGIIYDSTVVDACLKLFAENLVTIE